jgi:hypothetical protein
LLPDGDSSPDDGVRVCGEADYEDGAGDPHHASEAFAEGAIGDAVLEQAGG